MKYFVVNNNYHILDIHNHINNNEDTMLIVIPHFIDEKILIDYDYEYQKIESPFKSLSFMSPVVIYKKKVEIKTILNNINETDTLYIYAEEEWLVHYIVKLFLKKSKNVILLEDGGLPNYLKFSALDDHSITFRSAIKILIIKIFWFFWFSKSITIGKITYPRIKDQYFKSFNCYFDVKIQRNIPVKVIKKKDTKIELLNNNNIIFLNEYIYKIFCNWNEYTIELKKLITIISNSYETVYFKFHPRERAKERELIKKTLAKVSNIVFINDDSPVETIYKNYKAGYIASYHSAALMDAYFKGIIPVYLYHLCESIKMHPVSLSITEVLNSIGYEFPKSLNNIKPGYYCGNLKTIGDISG